MGVQGTAVRSVRLRIHAPSWPCIPTLKLRLTCHADGAVRGSLRNTNTPAPARTAARTDSRPTPTTSG